MKKQINLFVLAGVVISSISISCKAQGNTVIYSAQGQTPVNKVYKKPSFQPQNTNQQQPSDNSGYETTYQTSNVYVSKNGNVVYQTRVQDVNVQSPYDKPAVESANMPQVIDMRQQSQANQQRPACQNQNVYTAPPAPSYTNNVKAINSINGTQLYNNGYARPNYNQNYQGSRSNYSNNYYTRNTNVIRNRQLDHDLSNRPNAYTVVDEMYTPEYRAMMSGDPNYQQYAQSNYYTEGEMTFSNGNIQSVGSYQPQPLPGYQHHEYVAPPQPRVMSVQTYVTPVDAQQTKTYSQNTTNNRPAPQQQAMTGDVLYFKNGAKLSGNVISLDENICQFRMTNGSVANYSSSDILKIEKY